MCVHHKSFPLGRHSVLGLSSTLQCFLSCPSWVRLQCASCVEWGRVCWAVVCKTFHSSWWRSRCVKCAHFWVLSVDCVDVAICSHPHKMSEDRYEGDVLNVDSRHLLLRWVALLCYELSLHHSLTHNPLYTYSLHFFVFTPQHYWCLTTTSSHLVGNGQALKRCRGYKTAVYGIRLMRRKKL